MVVKEKLTAFAKKVLPHSFRRNMRLSKWNLKYSFAKDEKKYCPVLDEPVKTFIVNNNQLLTHKNEALSRHRMIMHFLRNETDLLGRETSILHIAPGPCLSEVFLGKKDIKYIGLDKFEPGYDYPDWVVNGDVTDLAFEAESFDLVICNHVLEHVHEDKKAMEEIFNVLKKGGFAIITVPIDDLAKQTQYDPSITDPSMRKKLYGQWDHVRQYSLDIVNTLDSAGFTVDSIKYKDKIGTAESTRLGIQEDYLFICKKS